jgi:hypothetical protein
MRAGNIVRDGGEQGWREKNKKSRTWREVEGKGGGKVAHVKFKLFCTMLS